MLRVNANQGVAPGEPFGAMNLFFCAPNFLCGLREGVFGSQEGLGGPGWGDLGKGGGG